MRLTIEIPDYEKYIGVEAFWEEGGEYVVNAGETSFEVVANKAGMISLAEQLLYFAYSYNEIPEGSHIHYDPSLCKDGFKGGKELIITKMKIKE